MKKIGVLSLLALILVTAGVYAADGDVGLPTPREFLNSLYVGIASVLKYVVVDFNIDPQTESGIIYAKLLLLVILMSALYPAAKKFPNMKDHDFWAFILALAVSILGLQFITKDILLGVLLPYGAVAISLSVIIPLVLMGIFIGGIRSGLLRRISWSFLLVVFTGLAVVRSSELGNLGYLYVIGAFFALILIFMDGVFYRLMVRHNVEKYQSEHVDKQVQIRMGELGQLEASLAQATSPSQRTKIKQQIKNMQADIKDLTRQYK